MYAFTVYMYIRVYIHTYGGMFVGMHACGLCMHAYTANAQHSSTLHTLTPSIWQVSFSIVLHLCWLSLPLWLECGGRGGVLVEGGVEC